MLHLKKIVVMDTYNIVVIIFTVNNDNSLPRIKHLSRIKMLNTLPIYTPLHSKNTTYLHTITQYICPPLHHHYIVNTLPLLHSKYHYSTFSKHTTIAL